MCLLADRRWSNRPLARSCPRRRLGGYLLHTRQTGVVDNDAVDEHDALDQVKRFLSYMPANVWEMPRRQFR